MREHDLRRRLTLYVLTDSRIVEPSRLPSVVAAALEGGATAIQLREKTLSVREAIDLGRTLRRLTADAGALFIVNDRVDVAYAVEADGVHLGQDDLPAPVARQILGTNAIVGGSAGSLVELARSLAEGVDYLGVGPMYVTSTKTDAGEPVGPAMVSMIRAATHLPIVGVGGIGPNNAAPVVEAGADGVAVISSVIGQADVVAAARQLRATIDAVLARRRDR